MITVARIYSLVNPASGKAFYIGQSRQKLSVRLAGHIMEAKKKPNRAKSKYINNILWLGKRPEIIELIVLHNTTVDVIRDTEQAFIDFYGLTHNLVNTNKACINRIESSVNWEPYIKLFGTQPDSAVAKIVGCAREMVSHKRLSLGIAAWGTAYDNTKYIMPKHIEALLGTMSDDALGRLAGTSGVTIATNRRRLGIPAYSELTGNDGRIKPGERPWNQKDLPQWVIDALGTMPDYKLAEKAGVSKPVIARLRRLKGIESYAKQTGNNGQIKKGDNLNPLGINRWTCKNAS